MIHYHGTPISGNKVDSARFLSGRHAMISFFRPDDASVVMDVCQSFVLDNGAFSHWKAKKGKVNVADYHAWVESFYGHPGLDWCLIPDSIGGTEDENIELITTWLRIGCRVEGVPVWHLHESLDYLKWMTGSFRTISFGSSGEYAVPGTQSWENRMVEAMGVCTDELGRPRCRLHGLRMLDPAIFSRFPFSSADSTNAAVNAGSLSRFGMYKPPTAAQRAEVIANRIEVHNSSPCWIEQSKQEDMFNETYSS